MNEDKLPLPLDVGEGEGKQLLVPSISWKEAKGVNCFTTSIHPLMLSENGYEVNQLCQVGKSRLPHSVRYDLDFVRAKFERDFASRLNLASGQALRSFFNSVLDPELLLELKATFYREFEEIFSTESHAFPDEGREEE